MNCHEAREHWNLYHDSEGDAHLHFQIGEHLATCPECAEWFSRQSRLEGLLADKLRPDSPTPELWTRVLGGCGLNRPTAAYRRTWLVLAAACAAVALGLVWYFAGGAGRASPDLARLSAQWHRRLETGDVAPEFVSQSDLEIEDFLRRRVTFPVRCPPRKDADFAVQAAGVFQIADQPAAYLSGHVGSASVSIFVLPSDSLSAFPRQRELLEDEKYHHSREGPYAMVLGIIDQNAVLVIGESEPQRLEKVLSAYGTYPDPS
jgi:hypothetical protein